MTPAPGARLLRFAGDRLLFTAGMSGQGLGGWQAFLRTNLGRAAVARDEIVASQAGERTFAGSSWRDIPMRVAGEGWSLDLPLAEVGWFRAKVYLTDPEGRQHWCDGDDVGLAVHPDRLRSANAIYCCLLYTSPSPRDH
jgi:starch synthase (maltosyl-transferring)